MADVINFTKEKKKREAIEEELYIDVDDLNEEEIRFLVADLIEEMEDDALKLEDAFYNVANDFEVFDIDMEFDDDFFQNLDDMDDEALLAEFWEEDS